ncbi:MAG: DUF429 domain-containing protein [Caulobacterales bacterium]|nr:DUF429 domain-containing protein [Caulobacterales bacterium]
MKRVFIGFDSAWADNPKAPGAICALVLEGDEPATFLPPRLAGFSAAAEFVADAAHDADYVLIGIDQPLIVPNADGMRPCERVASSIIGKLGGGVQPARRGGGGARFFGDSAPIWRFLEAASVRLNPNEARVETIGRFAIEVFPALALPSLQPAIFSRGRAAKYNPALRSKFDLADWRLVCNGMAGVATLAGLSPLADWLWEASALESPRKADQDKLDAAICLLIAFGWSYGSPGDPAVIGCGQFGYIAALVSPEMNHALGQAAAARSIPYNVTWSGEHSLPAADAS